MPPIATFEDLVKNTPSFGETKLDSNATLEKGKREGRRKMSSSLDTTFLTGKKDKFNRRPHTRDGENVGHPT